MFTLDSCSARVLHLDLQVYYEVNILQLQISKQRSEFSLPV